MRRELTPVTGQLTELVPGYDFVFGAPVSDFSESEVFWNALSQVITLSRSALRAQAQGKSWRGFLVGAAGIAFDTLDNRVGVFTGFNIKPDEGGDTNVHAEQMVLEKLRRQRFSRLNALVVVSDTQPDQQSGLEPLTIMPCGLCRDMLEEAPEVDDKAPIVGISTDLTVCEAYDFANLKSFNEGSVDALSLVPSFNLDDSTSDNELRYIEWLRSVRRAITGS
jgi:cytidine deaminase